jgi:hypothetical protein
MKPKRSSKRSPRPLSMDKVLRYKPTPASRSTVRDYYAQWRKENGIPPRCDITSCQFHNDPLRWLGDTLPLILDHKSGNRFDNSPSNLRYLCPNCDSQQDTRGGKNRGRVQEVADGKFVLFRNDRKEYFLVLEPGTLRITGHAPSVVVAPIARTP